MSDLVARARAALDGVTPGTWCVSDSRLIRVAAYQKAGVAPVICGVHRIGFLNGKGQPGDPLANARFIAAARSLVSEMADRIEALEAENARLRGAERTAWERGRDAAAEILQDDINNALSWANAEPVGREARKQLIADSREKSRLRDAIRALTPETSHD